jgi:hypothetical protein
MAGLSFARMELRTVTPNKKTRRGGRVFVDAHETRATAYPARKMDSGRRAREVMPAAMRALDWFACGKVALFIRAER